MGDATDVGGSDLKSGIPEGYLANDATLVRHIDKDAILLARRGQKRSPLVQPAPITAGYPARA